MRVIGHRGAAAYVTENTIASISKALELGCTWIEIDIQAVGSSLFVFHDDDILRLTGEQGRFVELSEDRVRSLKVSGGHSIPTLQQVLDLVRGKASLNIEIKSEGCVARLEAALEQELSSGVPKERFLVSSFNHKELVEFQKRMPSIDIGVLLYGLLDDSAGYAAKLLAKTLNLSNDFIDRDTVDKAHELGLRVLVYTVDSREEAQRMEGLGVDAIFSNRPDLLSAPSPTTP